MDSNPSQSIAYTAGPPFIKQKFDVQLLKIKYVEIAYGNVVSKWQKKALRKFKNSSDKLAKFEELAKKYICYNFKPINLWTLK